jgi:hypothetical protein
MYRKRKREVAGDTSTLAGVHPPSPFFLNFTSFADALLRKIGEEKTCNRD